MLTPRISSRFALATLYDREPLEVLDWHEHRRLSFCFVMPNVDQFWGCVSRTCDWIFHTCRPAIKSRGDDSRYSPIVHCHGRIYTHLHDRIRQAEKYGRRQCYSSEGDSFSVVRLTWLVLSSPRIPHEFRLELLLNGA
jgi:hypothetical protein